LAGLETFTAMSFSLHVLPVLYALFVWWFSTGLILYLDRLPKSTFRRSQFFATVALIGALYGLSDSSKDASVAGAYVAFSCAIVIWGWQEIMFLMGVLTGPRRKPCPVNCSELQRFVSAAQAILYHELALIVSIGIAIGITWGESNQVGTLTLLILWVMRLSAKLNMFLGVRNLYETFLPETMRYLQSYFKRRPMNLLFPVSVFASSLGAFLLWRIVSESSQAFDVVGTTFLAALLTLAVIEHWFLVLPLPSEALWKWAMRSPSPEQSDPAKLDVRCLAPLPAPRK